MSAKDNLEIAKSDYANNLISANVLILFHNMYATELEQRIAELELPKTCEGCVFHDRKLVSCYKYSDCSREFSMIARIDRHKPKDNG